MRAASHLASIFGAFAGLAFIAIPAAQADVTLKEKTSVEGMMRMMNMMDAKCGHGDAGSTPEKK